MRLLILFFTIITLTTACNVSKEDEARNIYNMALEAYVNKNYNKSKVLLDSIIYNYQKEKTVFREAKDLMNIVYRTEQEKSLEFLDSLLTIREEEIKPLMDQFYIEDDQADVPVLIHKRQSASRAYERSYLRAHTDINGSFYISSHYTSERYIHHNQIRVDVDDEFAVSDTIVNDAYLRYFDDGSQYFEVVKYKKGSDNGTASFIAQNFNKRVTVTFIGPKSKYRILLTDLDKECIRDTYYLAMLLRESIQIKSQIRNVKTTLQKTRIQSTLIRND
ncbi:MAG: hypothetical protein J6Y82_08430 [Bacteroidales bacterium]|nr:hypothetical protein [Bacteroidales bacterium]